MYSYPPSDYGTKFRAIGHRFWPGDLVTTPSGRTATVLRLMADGKVELVYAVRKRGRGCGYDDCVTLSATLLKPAAS